MEIATVAEDGGGKAQFLFEDTDFEDPNFHAAAFVAKYRRVTSLESLRDQLRQYCSFLKDELYNIINRDYKDFITIATKLEGVDIRVEHLRKPLVDLRMDLTLLNDTMVSNIHVIREKMQQREEVARRRHVLESSIVCMEKLSDVDLVLAAMTSARKSGDGAKDVVAGKEKLKVRCRRDFIRAIQQQQQQQQQRGGPSPPSPAVSVMESSELERAAVALASAQESLTQQMAAVPEDAGQQRASSKTASASAVALRRSLETRLHKLLASLEECLRPRLAELLVTAEAQQRATGGDEAHSETVAPHLLDPAQKRSLGHLLRALAAVGKGVLAENLVAERIVAPLIRLYLTQGRVDGSQGRGSYSGLEDSLRALLHSASSSLRDVLVASEEVFSLSRSPPPRTADPAAPFSRPPPPVDLVMGGVLQPVLAALQQSFPAMFGSGIANVFHTSLCAVESFLKDLCSICGPQWKDEIAYRLDQNKTVVSFRNMWKTDLYFQLRSQEIRSRIDAAFDIASAHGLCSKVFDEVYVSAPPSASSVSDKTATASSSKQPRSRPLSLPLEVVSRIESELVGSDAGAEWRLAVTVVVVTEMLTCLHPSIMLSRLGGKFTTLVVKILMYYQTYLLNSTGYRAGMSLASFGNGDAATTDGTPQKMNAGHGASSALGVSDLFLAIDDTHSLILWIRERLVAVVERTVLGERNLSSSCPSPVRRCLETQARALEEVPPVLWAKMSSLLIVECRGGLKAVKSVAGKFRMTNKPPPDSPSIFVASILNPLQTFLGKYSSRIALLPPSSFDPNQWTRGVVESVTSAYCQQVQELMETAKQMDNALQRRSKLRASSAQGTPGSGGNSSIMTDSEKIALQMLLDVKKFGGIVKEICGVDAEELESYQQLLHEVNEGKRIIESKG